VDRIVNWCKHLSPCGLNWSWTDGDLCGSYSSVHASILCDGLFDVLIIICMYIPTVQCQISLQCIYLRAVAVSDIYCYCTIL
jgi:hypothetical protein